MLTYRSLFQKMPPRPKKSYGQHFLTDPLYCQRFVDFGGLEPLDAVLEIGAGTGQLTEALLGRCRRVIAVESDPELVRCLQKRFSSHLLSPQLIVLPTDILSFDWDSIRHETPFKLAGNLPYNISTRILAKMAERKDRFQTFTFMVQKEVADRILAPVGSRDYGFFTLFMEYHFFSLKGFDVPPGVFVPRPKVDSSVLQCRPRQRDWSQVHYTHCMQLLKKAFRHRRKTLWNNLKAFVPDRERLGEVFDICRIAPDVRPQRVDLAHYSCLSRMLESIDFK